MIRWGSQDLAPREAATTLASALAGLRADRTEAGTVAALAAWLGGASPLESRRLPVSCDAPQSPRPPKSPLRPGRLVVSHDALCVSPTALATAPVPRTAPPTGIRGWILREDSLCVNTASDGSLGVFRSSASVAEKLHQQVLLKGGHCRVLKGDPHCLLMTQIHFLPTGSLTLVGLGLPGAPLNRVWGDTQTPEWLS